MHDVIYRQAAIDALKTECSWTIYDEHGQLTPNGEEILETLKKIPSADAVEVVRCKNCKHWNTELTKVFMCYCPMEDRWTGDDYYCASEERKDAD